ncbi:MAG: universal stress protein [Rhodospirillaceae bacterium]|nr:universal stress protein [Rhodospirillaceae bacterium]
MYKSVLLPLDLNEKSSWEKVLPAARDICHSSGGTLHVMTVLPDYGMTIVGQYFPEGAEGDALSAALAELKKITTEHVGPGVALEHIIAQGTVYEQILEVAERIDADLIAMAARRPGFADFLLGDTAYKVVRRFQHSVMIVRA